MHRYNLDYFIHLGARKNANYRLKMCVDTLGLDLRIHSGASINNPF
jgi:uncharacterized protein YmfQ (DUF2313 family)